MEFNIAGAIDELARQEPLVGAFLLAIGLLFIFMGLRLSQLLVGLSYGVIGFVVGASMPGPTSGRIAMGLACAAGLAITSFFMPRPAVAVLAGLWTGLLSMLFAGAALGCDPQISLIIGIALFIAGASLVFVMNHEMTALVTSLEGTLLAIGGLIALANQSATLWSHMRSLLVTNPVFGPFAVLSGTVIGFYVQIAELQKKRSGRSG